MILLTTPMILARRSTSGAQEFAFTGSLQSFTAPAARLRVRAVGAPGGDRTTSFGGGGLIEGFIDVTPGATLRIVVGERGQINTHARSGAGGGGYSGVLAADGLTHLISAGGGGGSGVSGSLATVQGGHETLAIGAQAAAGGLGGFGSGGVASGDGSALGGGSAAATTLSDAGTGGGGGGWGPGFGAGGVSFYGSEFTGGRGGYGGGGGGGAGGWGGTPARVGGGGGGGGGWRSAGGGNNWSGGDRGHGTGVNQQGGGGVTAIVALANLITAQANHNRTGHGSVLISW